MDQSVVPIRVSLTTEVAARATRGVKIDCFILSESTSRYVN